MIMTTVRLKACALLGAAVFLWAAEPARAQSVDRVGDTRDACDGDDRVKFHGKEGEVSIPAPGSKTVDLPGTTTELHWFCGGDRERSANDKPFNRVKISRAGNGAIQWVFFRVTGSGGGQGGGDPSLVRVGDSFDACDRDDLVTLRAGQVELRAGRSVMVELDHLTRSLRWFCGKEKERVTNPNEFNRVQVERAGNGAIHWVFYRAKTLSGDDKGNFLHNVAGDVQLAARVLGSSVPVPTDAAFLKASLDEVWNDSRAEIADEFRDELRKEDDVRLDSLTLATAARGELRVAEHAKSVVLKYVVHQNTAQVTYEPAANASFALTFDVELVLVLPRSQPASALKVDRAVGFARHVELAGTGSFSNLAVELAKSFVRRKESSLSAKSRLVTDRINEELAELRGALLSQVGGTLPAGLDNLDVDAAGDGTLRVCLNARSGQACTFPEVGRPNTARAVLERDGDSCGLARVWLWDSEKGRFVDVRKGQQDVVVELNSPRFEWFCGDNTEPNPGNDEWATAPNRTYGVRVSRAASGDDITWEFLDWRAR